MADVAISCEDVWKSYRLYHQRSDTLKERILARRNRYEEYWALKGIDLEVPTGTTFGIIGANGSGKSTLLKTMARILTPDRGQVRVTGMLASILELGIGFHPELTGRENVYLGGSLLGRSRQEVDARYDEIVDFAGIEEFMDTQVKNYSTGMYARLAFAVAVSVEPEILLVDEVLSVGDQSFQLRCYDRIARFRADGRTVVIVSHSLETIRALCSGALWLDAGNTRLEGDARDVVAGYLAEVHGDAGDADVGQPMRHEPQGSGAVSITAVTFVNGEGEPAVAFRTGETMTIRVACRAEGREPGASCTVAVYRAENLTQVFAQNSSDAGVALELAGQTVLDFTVAEVPLLKGSYLVSVALHGKTPEEVYDWHERRYSFLVFDDPALPLQGGMVRVASHWRVSSAPVAV